MFYFIFLLIIILIFKRQTLIYYEYYVLISFYGVFGIVFNGLLHGFYMGLHLEPVWQSMCVVVLYSSKRLSKNRSPKILKNFKVSIFIILIVGRWSRVMMLCYCEVSCARCIWIARSRSCSVVLLIKFFTHQNFRHSYITKLYKTIIHLFILYCINNIWCMDYLTTKWLGLTRCIGRDRSPYVSFLACQKLSHFHHIGSLF